MEFSIRFYNFRLKIYQYESNFIIITAFRKKATVLFAMLRQ